MLFIVWLNSNQIQIVVEWVYFRLHILVHHGTNLGQELRARSREIEIMVGFWLLTCFKVQVQSAFLCSSSSLPQDGTAYSGMYFTTSISTHKIPSQTCQQTSMIENESKDKPTDQYDGGDSYTVIIRCVKITTKLSQHSSF